MQTPVSDLFAYTKQTRQNTLCQAQKSRHCHSTFALPTTVKIIDFSQGEEQEILEGNWREIDVSLGKHIAAGWAESENCRNYSFCGPDGSSIGTDLALILDEMATLDLD